MPIQLPAGDLWVFGYGSLMWRPGFEYSNRYSGKLYGYHRALCVWSWVHRGSREQPGLVFGLDRGGSCIGRLYQVNASQKQAVADYLYARELVTPVYLPRLVSIHAAVGKITALTFTVDREHPQYAGKLDDTAMLSTVRHARGRSGINRDYLLSTVSHLVELGINEPRLNRLAEQLLRLTDLTDLQPG